MNHRVTTIGMLSAAVLGLLPAPAKAQGPATCPPVPTAASSNSVETKAALEAVPKLLGKAGLDVNIKTTRDAVLKDHPNANQMLIVLTMANMACQQIWADTSLSPSAKADKVQAMFLQAYMQVVGPAPVARTDTPKKSHLDGRDRPASTALLGLSTLKFVATNDPSGKMPPVHTGFLREPPFYVTDANRHFVIVGSAKSQDEGVRLMNKYKAKAPQHDFVLYGPYGNNPSFALMMATWVPRDVAMEALRLARRDVVSDAYAWSCRGSGERC